jgi:hypothetical protein
VRYGQTRMGRLVLATLIGIVAVVWRQPYSVVSPYRAYSEPARHFLRAALALDSLELRRQAVSAEPVQWALQAARANPSALAVWAQVSRPRSGLRRGIPRRSYFRRARASATFALCP